MLTFQIYEHSYKDKKYILDVKSKGKVESTKYFPVFENYDKEYIFKPLSKTKPLLTPLFAYSEVYWSYLINKYIDNSTPRYRIATCKGLSDEQKKYQDKGTIVANVLGKDEKLINLLELYRKYPDSTVNIDDYTNYCEVQYNYEDILNSTFFEMRKDLRAKLCLQILCSVLRRDANYHYENVSFIEKDGKIVDIAPMIDMEFSEMFMYPDFEKEHKSASGHSQGAQKNTCDICYPYYGGYGIRNDGRCCYHRLKDAPQGIDQRSMSDPALCCA